MVPEAGGIFGWLDSFLEFEKAGPRDPQRSIPQTARNLQPGGYRGPGMPVGKGRFDPQGGPMIAGPPDRHASLALLDSDALKEDN